MTENATSPALAGMLLGPGINTRFFGLIVPKLQFHFTVDATFSPIHYLQSEHIMKSSVC
jgi:hypothetical protein